MPEFMTKQEILDKVDLLADRAVKACNVNLEDVDVKVISDIVEEAEMLALIAAKKDMNEAATVLLVMASKANRVLFTHMATR